MRQGLGTLGSRKCPCGILGKFTRNVEEEELEMCLSPLGLNALLLNTIVTPLRVSGSHLDPINIAML